MGNCVKPTPSDESMHAILASLPKTINVDCTPIKESGLPIIFVIGGPAVGKRAVTVRVAEKYGLCEIITADIIRREVAKRSERAFALARLISEGQLVPRNILVELIALKMLDQLSNRRGFILSGFPRELSQSELFDREIRPPDLVLYLSVRDSVLSDRIMARSVKETERMSVTFDHIKTKINDFHKRNKPILKYYNEYVVIIDAEHDTLTVFEAVCQAIDPVLANFPGYKTVTSNTSNATNASARSNANSNNVTVSTNATTSKSNNAKSEN